MFQFIDRQIITRVLKAFLIVSLFCIPGSSFADENPAEREKFNAGDLIVEHVADNHEWHILGEGKNAIALPLPVILYNKDRGLTCFMSSRFHHGEMAFKGYKIHHGD